jgi:hypothetical protein
MVRHGSGCVVAAKSESKEQDKKKQQEELETMASRERLYPMTETGSRRYEPGCDVDI